MFALSFPPPRGGEDDGDGRNLLVCERSFFFLAHTLFLLFTEWTKDNES